MTNIEAIDILRKLAPPRTSKKHFDDFMQARDMAINSLSQSESQWVSCKDKLPPSEKKTYWVCLGNGSQCECRWTNDIYGFGEIEDRWGWSYLDKPQYSTIVAWRELPDPYTESEVAE